MEIDNFLTLKIKVINKNFKFGSNIYTKEETESIYKIATTWILCTIKTFTKHQTMQR